MYEEVRKNMNHAGVMVAHTPTSPAYPLRVLLERRYHSMERRGCDGLLLSELEEEFGGEVEYLGRTAEVDAEAMELYLTPDGTLWGGYLEAFGEEPYLLPLASGEDVDEDRRGSAPKAR